MQGVHILSSRVINSALGTWKHHLGSERRQKPVNAGKYRQKFFGNSLVFVDGNVGRHSCMKKERRDAKSVRTMQLRARSTKVDEVGTTAGAAAVSINIGLQRYKEGKVDEALRFFSEALEMPLTQEEAQAALYNKACCHASRGQGQEAKDALTEALKKHELRFSVILSDPDLASFRALPEFSQLQEQARKGAAEVGSSFRRDLKLMSEVQSPFRGVRKFLYFGFALAAGIATLFTVPRLIAAFQGGETAPNLLDTAGNLGVNIGGGAVLVWLYTWDQQKEEEQLIRLSRDENLSRLPLRIGGEKVVELNQLRESRRPVILAGKRASVEKALQSAERFREKLIERGVVVIPLPWDHTPTKTAPPPAKPKGFGSVKKTVAEHAEEPGGDQKLEEIEQRAVEASAKRLQMVERRFRAEVVSAGEWRQWVRDQLKVEGLEAEEEVYLVLRLDGRLRKSGRGMPDWDALVSELPVLDSLISKLER